MALSVLQYLLRSPINTLYLICLICEKQSDGGDMTLGSWSEYSLSVFVSADSPALHAVSVLGAAWDKTVSSPYKAMMLQSETHTHEHIYLLSVCQEMSFW